jgi:hypothetical protein
VCLIPVQAGASHRYTEFLQPGQRRPNGVLAVRDVVGTSHAIEASELQGLACDWTGVEAFAGRVESSLVGGVFGRWVSEQALEVGEYQSASLALWSPARTGPPGSVTVFRLISPVRIIV